MKYIKRQLQNNIIKAIGRFFSVILMLSFLALLSSFVNEQQEMFASKTPGVISFKAKNDRYSAQGFFERWKFTKSKMKERNNMETYTGELMIDMSSIKEKSQKLTDHLKADDYFFVKEFPICKMSIDNIKKGKDNKYTAVGTINLRGIKSEVPINFIVKRINPVIVKGQVQIDRILHKVGVANKKVQNKIEVDFEAEIPYSL